MRVWDVDTGVVGSFGELPVVRECDAPFGDEGCDGEDVGEGADGGGEEGDGG